MAYNEKDFSAVVTSTALPATATEVIRQAAIEQLTEVKNLRRFGVVQKASGDEGANTYSYYIYDDLSAAYDRVENTDFKYDAAGATKASADFVQIAKGFQLSWDSAQLTAFAFQSSQVKAAIDQIKDREDYKIATILTASSALTSTVTAAGVLSGTSADPLKDLEQAKRKTRALGYESDVLLIEDVNLEELISIIGSNEWYAVTEAAVRNGGLPVFSGLKVVSLPSGKLAHGTAIIFKSGVGGCFEIGQAYDVRTKIFDDNDAQCTKVQVYEKIAPVVVRPDAGAKLTGW